MKYRREMRRIEAEERKEAREKLGDEAQLLKLIENGYSGCKEARRLRKRLQAPEFEEEPEGDSE